MRFPNKAAATIPMMDSNNLSTRRRWSSSGFFLAYSIPLEKPTSSIPISVTASTLSPPILFPAFSAGDFFVFHKIDHFRQINLSLDALHDKIFHIGGDIGLNEAVRNILGLAADVTGILGFFLSIALLIKSEAMRKELARQRQDYKKEQRKIQKTLVALRSNVVDDKILNVKVVSDIRTELYSFQQKFKHLLSWKDKWHIFKTLHILNQDVASINSHKLCRELDYFVARFERKETQS